jgi:hypothetical protein
VFYEDELVLGLWDAYPVSEGHALVITRRHVATWFDANADEQAAVMRGVEVARAQIEKTREPDGYNVGFNAGGLRGRRCFTCMCMSSRVSAETWRIRGVGCGMSFRPRLRIGSLASGPHRRRHIPSQAAALAGGR